MKHLVYSVLWEEFEDPKVVITIRISKKNRQDNGRKKINKKYKQRSTKHTHKTRDRVTRTPLNIGGEPMCPGRASNSWSSSDTQRKSPLNTHLKKKASLFIFQIIKWYIKHNIKKPNRYSGAIIWRKADNTVHGQKKKNKRTNKIYKALHTK